MSDYPATLHPTLQPSLNRAASRGMTLEDVAYVMGLSVEQVRQAEISAIRKLRKNKDVMKLAIELKIFN